MKLPLSIPHKSIRNKHDLIIYRAITRNRIKVLRSLWKLHNGICQRCGCWCIPMIYGVKYADWEVSIKSRTFITPLGWVYSQATIQHVIPKSHGGTDDFSNLTLYCWHCNNEDNQEICHLTSNSGRVLSIKRRMKEEGILRRTELLRWADDGGTHPEGRISGGPQYDRPS